MTRVEAPQDPRPYVRVALDLPTNPKIMGLENPAEAIGAYVASLCLSSQSMGDGQFSVVAVRRLTGVGEATAMALAEQGLWHLPGHACDRCEQPRAGHAVIHDYLRHQRSADDVRTLSDKRRLSGRKGAQKRWQEARGDDPQVNQEAPLMASAMASAIAGAEQEVKQTDGNVMAEQSRAEQSRAIPPGGADEPRTKESARKPADNSQAVVAAFLEAATEAEQDRPTKQIIGKVGRDAKRLLSEGVGLAKLTAAARKMGAAGWNSLDVQLQRDSAGRANGGRRATTPYRDEPRHPRTTDYSKIFDDAEAQS